MNMLLYENTYFYKSELKKKLNCECNKCCMLLYVDASIKVDKSASYKVSNGNFGDFSDEPKSNDSFHTRLMC